MSILNVFQERDLQTVVNKFPQIFDQAVEDYAKFKVGLDYGLFEDDQVEDVLDWFKEFPKLWETIRPSFESNVVFTDKVDSWVARLKKGSSENGLGIAPLIIAGVAIAALFGVGGAIWAIGYAKKQTNVSRMIEGVTAGKIPSDVLQNAIKAESEPGFFSSITSLVKLGIIAGVLYVSYPLLKKVFQK